MNDSNSEDEIKKTRKRKVPVLSSDSDNSSDANINEDSNYKTARRKSARILKRSNTVLNQTDDSTKASPKNRKSLRLAQNIKCKTKTTKISKSGKTNQFIDSSDNEDSDSSMEGTFSSSNDDVNPENKDMTILPRKSPRLKQKNNRSVKTPNRKERLESVCQRGEDSPFTAENDSPIIVKRRCQSNNFIYENNSYNKDTTYDLHDIGISSEEDDFIVDDEEVYQKRSKKKRKKEKKQKHENSSKITETESENDDSIHQTKSCKTRKIIFESSDEENLNINALSASSSPTKSQFIEEERAEKTSTRARSINKKKNMSALEKLKKKRARHALPVSQRKKGEEEEEKSDDSETDNRRIDNTLCVHSSDENFIDDDSYGEQSNSEEEDLKENNKWMESLQNVLKMFHNPVDGNKKVDKSFQPDCGTVSHKKKQTNKKYKHLDSTSSDETDEEMLMLRLSEDEQKFCDCVMSNDIETLKTIPNFAAYVNLTLNKSKHTALHIATMKGHLSMIEFLISQKANTSVTDEIHFIPLAYAVLHKFPDCLKYLLNETNLTILPRLHKHWKGSNLLHFLVTIGETTKVTDVLEEKILQCLHIIKEFNKKIFSRYLKELDCNHYTPLLLALNNDLPMKQPSKKLFFKTVLTGEHYAMGCIFNKAASRCFIKNTLHLRCQIDHLKVWFEDQIVKVFLETLFDTAFDEQLLHFPAEENETFLHYAVQYSARCLKEIMPYIKHCINAKDISGFTPLMYTAELGRHDCMQILLENGAHVNVTDNEGTSPLHLAAASGDVESIQLLLKYKHPVNCVDKFGWPPLLYANFKAKQDCVVCLINANPRQIFCLRSLLHNEDPKQREKNTKTKRGERRKLLGKSSEIFRIICDILWEKETSQDVDVKNQIIRNTLLSISHIDAYYTLFNDFIGNNLSLLDENDVDVFAKTWRMILSFENKTKWMRNRSVRQYSYDWSSPQSIRVDRNDILGSAMQQLVDYSFSIQHLDVRFKNEEGIMLGPKREFFTCLVKDFVEPGKNLLDRNGKEQYSLTANTYFLEYLKKDIEKVKLEQSTKVTTMKNNVKKSSEILADNKTSDNLSRDIQNPVIDTVTSVVNELPKDLPKTTVADISSEKTCTSSTPLLSPVSKNLTNSTIANVLSEGTSTNSTLSTPLLRLASKIYDTAPVLTVPQVGTNDLPFLVNSQASNSSLCQQISDEALCSASPSLLLTPVSNHPNTSPLLTVHQVGTQKIPILVDSQPSNSNLCQQISDEDLMSAVTTDNDERAVRDILNTLVESVSSNELNLRNDFVCISSTETSPVRTSHPKSDFNELNDDDMIDAVNAIECNSIALTATNHINNKKIAIVENNTTIDNIINNKTVDNIANITTIAIVEYEATSQDITEKNKTVSIVENNGTIDVIENDKTIDNIENEVTIDNVENNWTIAILENENEATTYIVKNNRAVDSKENNTPLGIRENKTVYSIEDKVLVCNGENHIRNQLSSSNQVTINNDRSHKESNTDNEVRSSIIDGVCGPQFPMNGGTDDAVTAAKEKILESQNEKLIKEMHAKIVQKEKSYQQYVVESRVCMQQIRFMGYVIGQVLLSHDINISLQFTKPLIKQLLKIPLQHPEELAEVDEELYSNIKDNEMEGLELPFSFNAANPWNKQLEEIVLSNNEEDVIDDSNKMEYLRLVSQLKFERMASREVAQFKRGLYSSIRSDVLNIFNADEFSLLLNGVVKVDVEDWKKNTKYSGWPKDSPIVTWFWKIVDRLKTEEISLLLKFATGSPCVPIGGFSQLLEKGTSQDVDVKNQGLSGDTTQFHIDRTGGMDRLPEAHTCVNQLCLPAYSSESVMSEKLLVAIRHGCEGFAFH